MQSNYSMFIFLDIDICLKLLVAKAFLFSLIPKSQQSPEKLE